MLATSIPSTPGPSHMMDVGALDFQQKVLYASLQKPVLAYFTASWCGPCQQLKPLIEKLAAEYAGQITVARVDIDLAPEIAQSLRIQSVPTVYAFIGAQPVDGFMGALPESELRKFFSKIIQMAGFPAPEAPEAIGDKEDPFAPVFIAWGDGNLAAAIDSLQSLPPEPRVQAIRQLLQELLPYGAPQHLAQMAQTAQTPTAESTFHHGQASLAQGQLESAIAALLTSIRLDRQFQESSARLLLLQLFDALGFEHPLAIQGRKDLSKILFA